MKKTNKACKPLSSPSHFGNGTLATQRANDRIRRAKQREGPREGVSPVSISITLFISSYRYYAITNTNYTQYYINGTVRLAPHDACSICLVLIMGTCEGHGLPNLCHTVSFHFCVLAVTTIHLPHPALPTHPISMQTKINTFVGISSKIENINHYILPG